MLASNILITGIEFYLELPIALQNYGSSSFHQTIYDIFLKIRLTVLPLYKDMFMSVEGYEGLKVLNRKLDELLTEYNRLKTECADIKNANELLRNKVQERDARIKELESKYERIKLSGALLGEDENGREAKKKINELVREIDRCVALLNR